VGDGGAAVGVGVAVGDALAVAVRVAVGRQVGSSGGPGGGGPAGRGDRPADPGLGPGHPHERERGHRGRLDAEPRRRAAPPKLVTLNNALVAAVHPDGVAAAQDPATFGAWVENACLAYAWNAGQRLHYWREEPLEVEASKYSLNYIKLDGGTVGCMVNGAGLAMATMDTIKLFGGSPANFLDVGGSATAEKVTAAFKIMLSNKKVKAILVNIFGGIMKCDTIASGVVTAARETKLPVPLVVRMKGTNEDLGKKILKDSGLPIISADNMADAAKSVVASIKKKKSKPAKKAPAKKKTKIKKKIKKAKTKARGKKKK